MPAAMAWKYREKNKEKPKTLHSDDIHINL